MKAGCENHLLKGGARMEIHQLKCDQCGKVENISDKNHYFGGPRMKWRLIDNRPWPEGIKDFCSDICLSAAIAESQPAIIQSTPFCLCHSCGVELGDSGCMRPSPNWD